MGAREMHFLVGVDNVFDQDPPSEIPLSVLLANTAASYYDIVPRRFRAGGTRQVLRRGALADCFGPDTVVGLGQGVGHENQTAITDAVGGGLAATGHVYARHRPRRRKRHARR